MLPGPSRIAFKGHLHVTYNRKFDKMVARSWPRGNGGMTPARQAAIDRFKLMVGAAKNATGDQIAEAKRLSKGTTFTYRDILHMIATGRFHIIIRKDGGFYMGWAMAFETVQLMLDSISNRVGAILVRDGDGWVVLLPPNAEKVLTFDPVVGFPQWEDPPGDIQTELDTISNVEGTVLYRDASGWSALAPGAANQVLTTAGASHAPFWGAGNANGYPAGSPPTVRQVAFNSSGCGVTFASAPQSGNLLVAFTCNPTNNTLQSGWTRDASNTGGTDFGDLCSKVCGASESTSQQAITGSSSGGVMMWELHKTSGTAAFLYGATQTEFIGVSNQSVLFPNMKDCIGLSSVHLITSTFTFEGNVGAQDVLNNSGNRRIFASHTDMSLTPMVGLATKFAASASSKSCTAVYG